MKLSDRTLNILKNFTTINNSLSVKKGNIITTVNQGKSLLVRAVVEENFNKDFAIYDLNRFLSTYSLFSSKPEIVLHDKFMEIKNDNKVIKYIYCDPQFILVPPDKKLDIEVGDYMFSITNNDLQQLMKAIAVMKFANIEFKMSNGDLSVRAFDIKNPTGDDFSIKMQTIDNKANFNAVFRTELLKFIPDTYEIKISKGIAQFSSSDMIYWIAVEREHSNFS